MKSDHRLWRTLHVLIHMQHSPNPITSEAIGRMLGTHAVVVRRTMAGLREAGYVRSEKGHGGGWKLSKPLAEVTLLDVYRALGEPSIFAIGSADDDTTCLVEVAVNQAIAEAMQAAEALLLERFGQLTLDRIEGDFQQLLTQHPCAHAEAAARPLGA